MTKIIKMDQDSEKLNCQRVLRVDIELNQKSEHVGVLGIVSSDSTTILVSNGEELEELGPRHHRVSGFRDREPHTHTATPADHSTPCVWTMKATPQGSRRRWRGALALGGRNECSGVCQIKALSVVLGCVPDL